MSFDRDPADRRGDRLLAYLGLLDDAAPLFRSGERIPHAGVLLALPALITSGVFTIAREVYGSLGPAFYGLRTTLVAMLLMVLLRIKRPEALKEHAPDDLGRLLGLDRAPEVKTLRRKLLRLAAVGRAPEFGRALEGDADWSSICELIAETLPDVIRKVEEPKGYPRPPGTQQSGGPGGGITGRKDGYPFPAAWYSVQNCRRQAI